MKVPSLQNPGLLGGLVGAAVALTIGSAPGLARAADPSFAVKIEAAPAKKGEKAVAKIHVSLGAGYHMNKDYPTQVSVVAPAGISIERPKLTPKDGIKLEEAGADFEVAYTAAEPGKRVITGEFRFAVCTKTTCDPKKEKLSIPIDVK